MDKPAILALDDEPSVLAAISRDLRRKYGPDYRILRASSGEEALAELRAMRLRDEVVALFLVDQRMPGMTGVEFLAEAIALHPKAKKVLLTAYADTDAAIRAINDVRLDYYLMKPWDPPEEILYPVLDDLLDDWRANYRPVFEGVRVIGDRWAAESHQMRDFLARNLIPYRWLDIESDAEATDLRAMAELSDASLPIALLPDGTALSRPPLADLAEKLGLHVRANAESYDLVIVGAGPAGLAAAVYGASEGLRTLLLEREAPGGQAGTSSAIENYLGFPVGLSGGDLTRRAVAQARRFGAEILAPMEATGLTTRDGYHRIRLGNGATVTSQAVVVATGVQYRMLNVPGADRLAGAGLYYGAAITEALAVQGEEVFVVGAGNSAGQAALYLSRYAAKVTMLVRGRSLAESMSQYLVDRLEQTANVAIRTGASISALHGDQRLEAISVSDADEGRADQVAANAIFVFIGAAPRTDWLGGALEADPHGFVLTGLDLAHKGGERPRGWTLAREPYWLEASIPGIFVAGDLRHRSTKRIASAVGEGAMAVQFVHQHLNGAPPAAPAVKA